MRIGVFDSGLGGLTILKAILAKLPQYDYIYFGDNARVPYGNKSKEIIYRYTKQAIDFLAKKNCSLIIIACNTVSAAALRRIQREYLPKKYPNIKILGVIRPTVEEAATNGSHRLGVIGTKATIKSGAFVREIKKLNSKIRVYQLVTPLLVPLIEKTGKVPDSVLEKYLKPLKNKGIDDLILGCTHYELVQKDIQRIMGKNIKVITEGKIVAKKLEDYLNRHPEIEQKLSKKRKRIYHTTRQESKIHLANY